MRPSVREGAPWGSHVLKLGIEVSQSTVAKYLAKSGRGPSQTWKTFLNNHAAGIGVMDFLVVPTVGFRGPGLATKRMLNEDEIAFLLIEEHEPEVLTASRPTAQARRPSLPAVRTWRPRPANGRANAPARARPRPSASLGFRSCRARSSAVGPKHRRRLPCDSDDPETCRCRNACRPVHTENLIRPA